MVLVNLMKFDKDSCALVSDEEYWHLRRRRLLYGDFVQSLLKDEIADAMNLEVVYGSTGTPSFGFEVVNKTRKELNQIFCKRHNIQKKSDIFHNVDDVSKILLRNLHNAFHSWADNKLKGLYGFDSDDLTRGFFEKDGEKLDINQKAVKDAALKIAQTAKRGTPLDNILEHQGLIVGWDQEKGIQAFYFNYEDFILYQSATDIDCIGKGKDVSQVILANYLNKKHLRARRQGFDRVEAIIELIASGFEAQAHVHEVGGYFNIVCINGKGKNHKERLIEINRNSARVANEVVIAYRQKLLSKSDAFELVDGIIFQSEDHLNIENSLFDKVKDPVALDFVLRGYKEDFIPANVEDHEGIPKPAEVEKPKEVSKGKGGRK
jgi:hypothetical protein